MVELPANYLRLTGVIVKVFLFAGDFEVAAAGEIAINIFIADNLLDAVDGLQRRGVHALRALAAVHRNQLIDPELHAGKNHAAIAGTGSPADGFRFEDSNLSVALGEGARGGEPRKARSHYGNIDAGGERARFGRGKLCGRQPVVLFL